MINSFWLPLLKQGGLGIDTRKDGPKSPIVMRTIVQLDAGLTTFVDLSEGGGNPDMLARHNEDVRKACAPLTNALKWMDYATTATAAVLAAIAWVKLLDTSSLERLLISAASTALTLLVRRFFPQPFVWFTREVCLRVFRFYVRRQIDKLA